MYGNNLMLGSINDNFGVCERGVWAVVSLLTQVSLKITFGRRASCLYVFKGY